MENQKELTMVEKVNEMVEAAKRVNEKLQKQAKEYITEVETEVAKGETIQSMLEVAVVAIEESPLEFSKETTLFEWLQLIEIAQDSSENEWEDDDKYKAAQTLIYIAQR